MKTLMQVKPTNKPPFRKDIHRHDSMRGWFAYELYKHMQKDKDIWVLTGDLGYGMLDNIRDDFIDRFINTGAAEQAMMDIAVGLALSGKKPFVYSITPFLIYRPFDTIRTYINHELIPVRLVGSGRNRDYSHDGISHWAEDVPHHMKLFKNIVQYYPHTKENIPAIVESMVNDNEPAFISLRR